MEDLDELIRAVERSRHPLYASVITLQTRGLISRPLTATELLIAAASNEVVYRFVSSFEDGTGIGPTAAALWLDGKTLSQIEEYYDSNE